MEIWKKNLWACWFGVFIVSSGMSQLAPILPLYVEHLGVHSTAEIAQWSGIIFGSNFISLAIFSPIWGNLADKYGRRTMILRASLWLSVIMTCMGFAHNVYQLAGLRILQGALSGFQSAAITLIATQTPKEQSGWALGVLFSGQVGGALIGPFFGGYLSEIVGYRGQFFIIGVLCFIAFLVSLVFIKEKVVLRAKNTYKFREIWLALPNHNVTICLFITTFIMQLALMSIQPIITVYITQLSSDSSHIALIAGAVFAASGLASMLAASSLGKISDRIGSQKVLLVALFVAGVTFIPQAFVSAPWQLGMLRFLLGIVVAGLLPSINNLIKQNTPESIAGQIFGYNQTSQYLGMFAGSVLGGQMAAAFSIRVVLLFTGALLLVNALWVYFTVYKKRFITSTAK